MKINKTKKRNTFMVGRREGGRENGEGKMPKGKEGGRQNGEGKMPKGKEGGKGERREGGRERREVRRTESRLFVYL